MVFPREMSTWHFERPQPSSSSVLVRSLFLVTFLSHLTIPACSRSIQESYQSINHESLIKGNAVLVTDSEGPCGCETSRLIHFLDNRLTNTYVTHNLLNVLVQIANKMGFKKKWWRGQPHAPAALHSQEHSWYSFLLQAGSTFWAIMRLVGLGKLKNPISSSGTEFGACRSNNYATATSQPITKPSALNWRSRTSTKLFWLSPDEPKQRSNVFF
jgi:hypothetical protein